MKFKFLTLMMAVAFLFVLVACGNGDSNGNGGADEPDEPNVEVPGDDVEVVRVALLAHSDDSILDDGSFNQGAWDGIRRFYEAQGLSVEEYAGFFQPHEGSDEARIDLIQDAVGGGFDILVLPGFHFEVALYEAQSIFPDTKFVLLDASPRNPDGEAVINDNVVAIHYAEEEAGFLAGYAAVTEGFRELGFIGGLPVPAVVRFGHGFVQGAEHAASELGLSAGDVTIEFAYFGGFGPTPERQTQAASWFAGGTEVIFAAAGGAGASVMAAADQENGVVIGVDVDQATHSDTVITSAVKGLEISVYNMLNDFSAGNFNGGRELMFNSSIDGVGLPMNTARFVNFTQEQYDNIFAQLASGQITVNPSLDMEDIDTTLVTVNEHD